jgi:hypothetical protein
MPRPHHEDATRPAHIKHAVETGLVSGSRC